ncbi:hypothetical protein BH11MYX1_BH11MYX1_16000 [soil metagenome]
MMKALSLVLLALPVVACTVGPEGTVPVQTGSDDGSNAGTGQTPPPGGDMHITADTTWSSAMAITGSVMIDAGATVTVAHGTVLSFATGGTLTIKGTLDVQGVKGNTVTFKPATGAYFNDIQIAGAMKLAYVESTGGGFQIQSSATATITDSRFSQAAGDLVVMSGGTLSFMYSQVGLDTATGDTTHCDLHFGSGEPHITASHSSFRTSSYGLMFYSGQNADFTYTNWANNDTNVDGTAGAVTGDFSNSYFMGAAPVGNSYTLTNTSTTTMVPACDGTNDATCAGVR